MQVGQFPASAANSLIEGYCDDFVSLATVLAQTLEQVSIRGIKIDRSRQNLERLERGMQEMAQAIHELLGSGKVTSQFEVSLGRQKQDAPVAPPAPPPPPAAPAAARPRAPAAPARTVPPNPGRPSAPPPTPAAARPAPAAAARPPAPTPPVAPPHPPHPPIPAPTSTALRPSPTRQLLDSLERDRKSGTLYVQAGRETLAFEFVEGCITQSASDGVHNDERLGDLLVELGSCTRENLAKVFAALAPEDGHLLGEQLVREGTVTNRQVIDALEHQVRRRVLRAVTTPGAQFDFAEGERMPDDGRVRVPPSALFPKPGQRPAS